MGRFRSRVTGTARSDEIDQQQEIAPQQQELRAGVDEEWEAQLSKNSGK